MRRLLMRVFSVAWVVDSPLGLRWADDGAQEQVDRDTPVSRTLTLLIMELLREVATVSNILMGVILELKLNQRVDLLSCIH
jgi:hypothetical protein